MLLIIDDAWRADAALAFKVGGPNCAYLLTTRLANIALDFAADQVITVHELDVDDGLNLLTQMATPAVEADPDAARSLVQLVGGLPLALVLMGQHLQKQSYHAQPRRMRDALTELQTSRIRLELAQPQSALELRADLPPNTPLTLQTSIGLSDSMLDDSAHRALVTLALFPPKPNTFSEEAALTVIQSSAKVLDTLVDSGLVESIAPDRYAIHQTIADYASLEEAEPAAIERMVNYFMHYVENHAADHQALDVEFENILTTAETAFNSNLQAPLIRLADALYSPLELRGLYQIAERLLSQANTAALEIGNSKGQMVCLYRLGEIAIKQGEFNKAKTHLEQALPLARELGDPQCESHVLNALRAV
jgi:tetratricopeptide (TPR) repeat protein